MVAENQLQTFLDKIVGEVLANCIAQFFEGDTHAALTALRQKRADVCQAYTEELGKRLAQYLAARDPEVKKIYRYSLDPEGLRPKEEELDWAFQPAIHLVVWVGNKNPAFQQLLDSLIVCLREVVLQKGICDQDQAIPLDIHLVDDQEVQGQVGFGLFPASEMIRSQIIWPQDEPISRAAVQKIPGQEGENLLEELTSFDPKLAPEERILKHARSISRIPREQRGALDYHLMELKVTLVRKIISDQLRYLNIAKNWFEVEDLEDLYRRRIGSGKIGGKAAGMMLAFRILNQVANDQITSSLQIPESYFLGSDLIYIFMAMNGLMHWNDQKYKPEKDIRDQYEQIKDEFLAGEFPPEILIRLRRVLEKLGDCPIIVRSSSQLEDNFGTAFAGKYESFFLPNQGTKEENLQALTEAVSRIYASTLKPEALLYRRQRGLQDYDERMAVLIQQVQGERFGRYFLPHASGVAFSKNIYRWSPEICREDGFARVVWGLGTRAVGRVSEDYPRLIALSHPQLHPDDSSEMVQRYSQHKVDLIDLEDNQFKTLPVNEVLSTRYQPLSYLIQIDQGGYLTIPRMRVKDEQLRSASLTFQKLIEDTPFVDILKGMLKTLEQHYHDAVDLEFTVQMPDSRDLNSELQISLLQCRPQPHLSDVYDVQLPAGLPEDQVVFSSSYLVPRGYLPEIRQVVFVDPREYFLLAAGEDRSALSRTISRLNDKLPAKNFILVGPGRWGSTNPALGVFVSYTDIHNTGALIELSGEGVGAAPEPSLGTHFFQDLMEAEIYPLAIDLDHPETVFNQDFFYQTKNSLSRWLENGSNLESCLRVIEVAEFRADHHLELVMDDRENQSVAFLVPD